MLELAAIGVQTQTQTQTQIIPDEFLLFNRMN